MRRCSIASICCFIAATCAAFGQTNDPTGVRPQKALPQIPVPSGPFGIGRVGYDWADPSRPDRYSETNAQRELMVYFWYPTSAKSAAIKGEYLPGAQRMDSLPEVQDRMRQEFGSNWPAMVSGAIFSHAVERAPIAKSPVQYPVVVFSHGLGGLDFNYTCLIEDLVSHGYVVASIEHTYLALSVVFPDGRVVARHSDSPPRITVEMSEGAADVRFVLDRMTAANSNADQFLLAGRVDLNRVAAMGHSAGAEYAARACQLDARFRACVDLDGGMAPIAALPEYPDGAALKQPLLLLEADHPESQMGGTPTQHASYFKKKEEQLQATRPGSYDVVLQSPGIAHPSFGDIPLLFAGQDGFPQLDIVLHNLDLIEKYVRDFLGKTLRHESAPLLENVHATGREATIQEYGH